MFPDRAVVAVGLVRLKAKHSRTLVEANENFLSFFRRKCEGTTLRKQEINKTHEIDQGNQH